MGMMVLSQLVIAITIVAALWFRQVPSAVAAIWLGLALLAIQRLSPVQGLNVIAVGLPVAWLLLAVVGARSWRSLRAWFVLLTPLILVGSMWALDYNGVVNWGQAERNYAAGLVLLACSIMLIRWIMGGQSRWLGLSIAGMAVLWIIVDVFAQQPVAGRFGLAAAAIMVAMVYGFYRMAYVDQLTGLPNRRALEDALKRAPNRMAIAMVDVDHFKKFNDRFGHAVGDQALRMVATELAKTRPGNAYRYGGEEFTLVFEGRRAVEKAIATCDLMRERVSERGLVLRGRNRPPKKPRRSQRRRAAKVTLTVSTGVAVREQRGEATMTLIQRADKALYLAKSAGRNRVQLAKQ